MNKTKHARSTTCLLFPTICRVLERRCGLFVNGILACVPFGHLAFLLEARELSSIMNDGEQFPQEQQGEPDGNDGTDNTQDDAQNVEDGRALFRLLDADNEFVLVIVAVNKRHTAVVIIVKPALFI